MKKIKISFVCFVVLLLTACSAKDEYKPVEINSEIDVCTKCNMQISNDCYAVEYITSDGTAKKFDDIKCLLNYIIINSPDISQLYVRDFDSSEWIDGYAAVYVYDELIKTPMSGGIISFTDQKSAEAYMEMNNCGKIYEYAELSKLIE